MGSVLGPAGKPLNFNFRNPAMVTKLFGQVANPRHVSDQFEQLFQSNLRDGAVGDDPYVTDDEFLKMPAHWLAVFPPEDDISSYFAHVFPLPTRVGGITFDLMRPGDLPEWSIAPDFIAGGGYSFTHTKVAMTGRFGTIQVPENVKNSLYPSNMQGVQNEIVSKYFDTSNARFMRRRIMEALFDPNNSTSLLTLLMIDTGRKYGGLVPELFLIFSNCFGCVSSTIAMAQSKVNRDETSQGFSTTGSPVNYSHVINTKVASYIATHLTRYPAKARTIIHAVPQMLKEHAGSVYMTPTVLMAEKKLSTQIFATQNNYVSSGNANAILGQVEAGLNSLYVQYCDGEGGTTVSDDACHIIIPDISKTDGAKKLKIIWRDHFAKEHVIRMSDKSITAYYNAINDPFLAKTVLVLLPAVNHRRMKFRTVTP